jgi:tryptophan synthase alpha chain
LSRIATAFEQVRAGNRKGFIPFITAGDPDLVTTCELLVELAASGACAIELGVPFSDPMADGPVIQRASERALKHRIGIESIIEAVASVRDRMRDVPVVLFSYFNPLLQFGLDRLASQALNNGIDGVLVTDLAPEEAGSFHETLHQNGVSMIYLAAPTSSEKRLRLIANLASGFIYAVSRAGITGARADLSSQAKVLVQRIRSVSSLPIAVGFGISTHEQVSETLSFSDAAVVGSAIVSRIERLKGEEDLVSQIGRYCRELVSG